MDLFEKNLKHYPCDSVSSRSNIASWSKAFDIFEIASLFSSHRRFFLNISGLNNNTGSTLYFFIYKKTSCFYTLFFLNIFMVLLLFVTLNTLNNIAHYLLKLLKIIFMTFPSAKEPHWQTEENPREFDRSLVRMWPLKWTNLQKAGNFLASK